MEYKLNVNICNHTHRRNEDEKKDVFDEKE